MTKIKFAVILLAAGKSSRFGENKMLAIVRNKTMIDHSLDSFLSLDEIGPIIVVIGGYREQMQEHMKNKMRMVKVLPSPFFLLKILVF